MPLAFLGSYGFNFKEPRVQSQRSSAEIKIRTEIKFLVNPMSAQSTFTFSKLTIETLEQGVKYVQS